MKVIAKVDKDRVLCEVTIDELAMLNGFRNRWAEGFRTDHFSEVNTECNLGKMVATSQFVRGLRADVVKNVKERLEKSLEQVDGILDEVTKLELFELIKSDEGKVYE